MQNMIGNYNEQQGGGNPQGQQPAGLQAFFSIPDNSLPGPQGVSIPIRVDDQSGQRNCVVYLNFPPMNVLAIQQLISQLKAFGLNVADRKNFDDNNRGGYPNQNYNRGGYNQGGYNQGGYNQGGYNNYNRGGYGR